MKRIYLLFIVALFGAWTTQAQFKNIPTTAWTGTVSSSWSDAYGASNAIDGDTTTFWITQQDLAGPHWISFDLGKAYDIEGFRYTRRAGGTTETLKNGTIYDWSFQVSTDGTTWSTATAGTWTWATWAEMGPKEEITGTKAGIRYVRLNSTDGMNGYASCAEFDVLVTAIGADFMADVTTVGLGDPVTFTDKSDNDPTGWDWTFEGGTPATSTDQNPVVTYAAAGTYDVTLTVTYGDATTSSITFTDYVTAKKIYKKIPKGAWSAAVDCFQPPNDGSYAIDEDYSSIWHSNWDATTWPNPHWIVVDMGKAYDIEGFAYTRRPGGGNGTYKEWLFETSADSVTWDIRSGGDWTDALTDEPKEELTGTVTGVRYMRLTSISSVGEFGSCAEFDALVNYIGADFSADNTSVYLGSSVTFTDKSDNNPTGWAWTFEGGTPASSTEQNPVVAYNTMGTFAVSLTVTYADASTSTTTYPNYIDVSKQIPSTNWEAIYADSEELDAADRGKKWAIDGDESTFWHTQWLNDNPDYPHWIAVDMGAKYEVESFIYVGRDKNGGVGTASFYVVDMWPDRNDTTFWMDPAGWGDAVVTDATFDWSTGNRFQVDLATPATGRYFVFYATAEESGAEAHAVTKELYVIGSPAGATRIQKNSLNADVAIYPNPAKGNFTVEVGEDNATIRVYNATGTLVYQKKGASTTEQVGINSRGVYLIQIELNGATTTKKLIIR